jgi:hypothetical protein
MSEDDIGTTVKHLHAAFKKSRLPNVIMCCPAEIRSRRQLEGVVEIPVRTPIYLVPDISDARVSRSISPADFLGAIS